MVPSLTLRVTFPLESTVYALPLGLAINLKSAAEEPLPNPAKETDISSIPTRLKTKLPFSITTPET